MPAMPTKLTVVGALPAPPAAADSPAEFCANASGGSWGAGTLPPTVFTQEKTEWCALLEGTVEIVVSATGAKVGGSPPPAAAAAPPMLALLAACPHS